MKNSVNCQLFVRVEEKHFQLFQNNQGKIILFFTDEIDEILFITGARAINNPSCCHVIFVIRNSPPRAI